MIEVDCSALLNPVAMRGSPANQTLGSGAKQAS